MKCWMIGLLDECLVYSYIQDQNKIIVFKSISHSSDLLAYDFRYDLFFHKKDY